MSTPPNAPEPLLPPSREPAPQRPDPQERDGPRSGATPRSERAGRRDVKAHEREVLAAAEARLTRGESLSVAEREALEQVVTQCQLGGRLRARVEHVRALDALRGRALPEQVLDGLYQDVRAQVVGASAEVRWARAAMSGAFLDAPESLRLWRSVALAASLLLAVGVGFWAQGPGLAGGPPAGGRPLEPHDPRDALLAGTLTAPAGSEGVAGVRSPSAVPVSHGAVDPGDGQAARRAPIFIWVGRGSDAATSLDRLPRASGSAAAGTPLAEPGALPDGKPGVPGAPGEGTEGRRERH